MFPKMPIEKTSVTEIQKGPEEVFKKIKNKQTPEIRKRLNKIEYKIIVCRNNAIQNAFYNLNYKLAIKVKCTWSVSTSKYCWKYDMEKKRVLELPTETLSSTN